MGRSLHHGELGPEEPGRLPGGQTIHARQPRLRSFAVDQHSRRGRRESDLSSVIRGSSGASTTRTTTASPMTGYRFTVEEFPRNLRDATRNGDRAIWKLSRIDGEGSSTVVDLGTVDLPSADDYTKYMIPFRAYRLRLEWNCGNLRVRVQRIYQYGYSATRVLRLRRPRLRHRQLRPRGLLVHARRVERQRCEPDAGHHRSLSLRRAKLSGDRLRQLQRVGLGPRLQFRLRSLEPVDPDIERNDPLQDAV